LHFPRCRVRPRILGLPHHARNLYVLLPSASPPSSTDHLNVLIDFYLLDALPLFLAMSFYAYLWPTRVIDSAARNSSAGAQQSYLEAGGAVGRLETVSREKGEAHGMTAVRA
jgi:hypothetical protein